MGEPRGYARRKAACFERWDREVRSVDVVYAQGKTGTSSIAAALKRAGLDPVFQIHSLRRNALDRVEAEYRERRADVHPRHVWEGQWLGDHLPTPARPWRVVTSVRDPIARLVSRFFQRASRFRELGDDASIDEVCARLVAVAEQDLRRLRQRRMDWFEAELDRLLPGSVYDTPFDPSVGFGRIDAPNVQVLLLRGEDLDVASGALAGLFARTIEVRSENVGDQKSYADVYRAVLDRFHPPEEYVQRVYDTRQARHFYAPEELEAFRRRWSRPASGTA